VIEVFRRHSARVRAEQRGKLGRPKGSTTLLTAALTKAICAILEKVVPEKYADEANGIADEYVPRLDAQRRSRKS
jgi:hypothetical protein